MAINLETGLELRLRFQQDQQQHYTLHTRIFQEARDRGQVLGREEHEFNTTMVTRTLRVDHDGSGHQVTVTVPQVEGQPAMRQVIYQQLDTRGEVLEISGPNPGSTYSFPAEKVAVGGTWQGISKGYVPGRAEPVLTPYTYRLEGIEQRGGYECLQIEVVSDEVEFESPLPDGRMTRVAIQTTGRMFFAPDPGVLVRLELKSRTSPRVEGFEFETHNTITQDLVKLE